MHIRSLILLGLLALLAWASPAHAARSYDNCTGFVTSLPAVISTPGTWCLKQDLTMSITNARAITISSDHVTLDCNDFRIDGLAAGPGANTYGIWGFGYGHLTVRHCRVRGFLEGLQFFASTAPNQGHHVVEDNEFDRNNWVGIAVSGPESVVRRNRVHDIGGSTLAGGFSVEAVGIVADEGVDVLDNTVSDVMTLAGSNGSPVGIAVDDAAMNTVSGNHVSGIVATGTGTPQGISFNGSSVASVRNNIVAGTGTPGYGISCAAPTLPIRAKENVISGFATANLDCADGGGNDISP